MAIVQAIIDGILVAGLYGLVAIGLSLILGMLDVVNFAHGQIFVVGAYTAFVLVTVLEMPFVVAFLVAIVVAAILGGVMEVIVFRRVSTDHLRAITASLGLILIIESSVEYLFTPNPRTMAIPWPGAWHWGDISLSKQRLIVFAVAAALVIGFYLYTRWTRAGLALRAVADIPEGASMMGVRVGRMNLLVFIVGSGLAGAGGALLASLFPITPLAGDVPLLKGFIVAIVGGLGSIPGVISASLLLGITETVGARFISPIFRDGYGLIILVVVMLVRPHGIFGLSREERI